MLSQISILNIHPNSSWKDIETRYGELLAFWSPERFSHNRKEKRIAEFRLKEIRRAYEQLEEQKELFCDGSAKKRTRRFKPFGKLLLCHRRSKLKSTRRDVLNNARIGRFLHVLSDLFPGSQPLPWGRKHLPGNYHMRVWEGVKRLYSTITTPIELLLRSVSAGVYQVQLPLLFAFLLMFIISEAKMQIQAEGGIQSQRMITSQEERNSYVVQSVVQKFKTR